MYFQSKKALLSISIKFRPFRRTHNAIVPNKIQAQFKPYRLQMTDKHSTPLHVTLLLVTLVLLQCIVINKSELCAPSLGTVCANFKLAVEVDRVRMEVKKCRS